MNDSNAPLSDALQAALSSLRQMQHHWLPHQVVSLIEDAIGQLETVNDHISASSVANVQQYTHTNQVLDERVNELEELVHFSQLVHTRTSLQAVLDDTCKWALSGTKAEQAWAAVFDQKGDDPSMLRVVSGPKAGSTFPKTIPLVAATLESNTPQIYEPTTSTPARLVVPLLDETKAVGVLVAESQMAFTTEELNFLTRLTKLAAGAIGKVDLLKQVQDAKAERAKFVSTVAHELRLPMTSIMGYTDLLKQGAMGEVNENQLSFLKIIRENVGRMARLVSDLSDIYKAEGGRLHIDVAPVSLLQVVRNASETLESQLGVRGQKLEILVPEELPAIKADPKRAAQMVQYMLENASLYSPEGAPIEARVSMENGTARLMIVDRGIGIAPEDQAHLFTQFFRSEDEAVREHKGWGLSLCVVKSLSKLMDGEVGYETALGSGSTFWLTLPLMS